MSKIGISLALTMLTDQPLHLLRELLGLFVQAGCVQVLDGRLQMADTLLQLFRQTRASPLRATFELPDDLICLALPCLDRVVPAGFGQAADLAFQLFEASCEPLASRAGPFTVGPLGAPSQPQHDFTRFHEQAPVVFLHLLQLPPQIAGLFGLIVSPQPLEFAFQVLHPLQQLAASPRQLSDVRFRPRLRAQLGTLSVPFAAAKLPADGAHPFVDLAQGTLEFAGLCVLVVPQAPKLALDLMGPLLQSVKFLREAGSLRFGLAALAAFGFIQLSLILLAGFDFVAFPFFPLAGFALFAFGDHDELTLSIGEIASDLGRRSPLHGRVVCHGVGAARNEQGQRSRGQ